MPAACLSGRREDGDYGSRSGHPGNVVPLGDSGTGNTDSRAAEQDLTPPRMSIAPLSHGIGTTARNSLTSPDYHLRPCRRTTRPAQRLPLAKESMESSPRTQSGPSAQSPTSRSRRCPPGPLHPSPSEDQRWSSPIPAKSKGMGDQCS